MPNDGAAIRAPAGIRHGLVLLLAGVPLSACPSTPGQSPEPGTSSSSSTSDGPGPTTAADSTGPGTSTSSSGSSETGLPGELPPTPTPLSPRDGAVDLPLENELCWTPVEDPDGDAVRYRVFVDDIELSKGEPGTMNGHAGPCVGPLVFDHEQTYQWQVQAFEVDDPTRASARSTPWTFTIADDGHTQTVFEDRFETDRGWDVGGDALTGAWTRGDPLGAFHMGQRSQPSDCIGGVECFYTGQNLGGVPDDEDVGGGSTTLTSPPFDLGGAVTATVQLQRYFYKSEMDGGPQLLVELLVPDDGAPEGWVAHPLELLDQATATVADNRWTPREYAACGLPMVDGSRLRITATDQGSGILEAAIDSVSVHAHSGAAVCGRGEGARCSPEQGDAACPDPLLCCGEGPLNRGVNRCRQPVAGLDFLDPPPDPDAPGNGPLGCPGPDLIIDESWIEPVLTDIFVHEGTCELGEGCVGALGWRTILRFTMTASNVGSADLVLGVAANEPDIFHFSECHSHYHFDQFARFELRDGAGMIAATGHKPGFCLLDSYSWAWENAPGHYDCSNQGISRGYADIYESDLPCQWIDVTDVPPGDYTIWAEVNVQRDDAAVHLLNERDYGNNTVEVPVTLP